MFGEDPAALACRWAGQGATYLHLVDLDGARAGRPVNGPSVRRIVREAGVPCQLGGGVRGDEHLEEALGWGVDRVIVGSRALADADWFERACRRFPGRVALGLDARAGRVAAEGWLKQTEVRALDVARRYSAWPLAAIIYTDISRDGMLEGPNLEATAELAAAVDVPVFASGGVTTLDDVARLSRLGLAGCVIGRALYEGRLDLAAALRRAKSEGGSRASPGGPPSSFPRHSP